MGSAVQPARATRRAQARPRLRAGVYTAPVVSVALQPIMARAQAALERGDAARATEHLAPVPALDHDHPRRRADDSGHAGRGVAAAGRHGAGRRQPGPPARLPPRNDVPASPAVEPLAPARASGLHPRRTVARRSRCTRALRTRSRRTTCAPSAWPTSSWRAVTSWWATRPRCSDHFGEAASALHAVGDKRNLALVHSLSGSAPGADRDGTTKRSMAMRQAERLAYAVQADDVVAIACGNQANVAMMRHRYDQALALAERSVALHQQFRPGTGWRWRSATLGQICIHLGALPRGAKRCSTGARQCGRPLLFHETTGAIFDSLAQIHLIRGDYDAGRRVPAQRPRRVRRLRRAHAAVVWLVAAPDRGAARRRGAATSSNAALRRPTTSPRRRACRRPRAARVPDRGRRARLGRPARRGRASAWRDRHAARCRAPCPAPGASSSACAPWSPRPRGRARARPTTTCRRAAACSSCWATGIKRRCTQLVLGRMAAQGGARSLGRAHLDQAAATFSALGAARDLADVEAARARCWPVRARASSSARAWMATKRWCGASWTPPRCPNCWRARPCRAVQEATRGDVVVLLVSATAAESLASSRTWGAKPTPPAPWRAAGHRPSRPAASLVLDGLGAEPDGRRLIVVVAAATHRAPDRAAARG